MADKVDHNATKEYILKPGHEHHAHGEGGERHTFVGGEKGNDRVHLNANQAKAFSDKFESVEEQSERLAMSKKLAELQQNQADLNEKLANAGVTLDELLATIKKPDPSPSTGSAEPKPAGTTPAPTGSTSDPVNAPKGTSDAAKAGEAKKSS